MSYHSTDQSQTSGMSASAYICTHPNCGKQFKRKDYLFRHERNHASVKHFTCNFCSVSFARKDLIDKHRKTKIHCKKVELAFKGPQDIFVNSFATPFSDNKFSNVVTGSSDSYIWLFGDEVSLKNPMTKFNQVPFIGNKFANYKPDTSFVTQEKLEAVHEFLRNSMGEFDAAQLPLDSCNKYVSKYFESFDVQYPLIHRPTFEIQVDTITNTALAITIITFGMVLANQGLQTYTLATSIQKVLKLRLIYELEMLSEYQKCPIQLLQALVLCNYFQMFFGDRNQFLRSNIFHPMVLNLLKEINLYSNLKEPHIDSDPANFNEQVWRDWVKYESLKRVAFFGFITDQFNSFFFGRVNCISVFDIQLELPYTDLVWHAGDPVSFLDAYLKQPTTVTNPLELDAVEPSRYEVDHDSQQEEFISNVKPEEKWPNFLFCLRRLLQPHKSATYEYQYQCFPQFSRYIFLHGVISLIKELRKTSIMDMKVSRIKRINLIAGKIEFAFFNWKGYFYKHSVEFGDQDAFNEYGESLMFWSNMSMLGTGLLGLYCDFRAILQYNKVVNTDKECYNVQGLYGNDDEAVVKEKILQWCNSKDGFFSRQEACNILKMVLNTESIMNMVPHVCFTVYISVLICWFYENGTLEMKAKNRSKSKYEGDHKNEALEYVLLVEKDSSETKPIYGLALYIIELLKKNPWESGFVLGRNVERLMESYD